MVGSFKVSEYMSYITLPGSLLTQNRTLEHMFEISH